MTERLSLHFCVPGLPDGASGRTTHLPMQETIRDTSSIPGLGRSSGGGLAWELTPVFLPGESHGQRSLVGYSPKGREESDTSERLSYFSVIKNYVYRNIYHEKGLMCY